MSLLIQRVDDFVEAHKITDERQVFAIAGLIRVSERSDHDVAQLANVSHVNRAHIWIKRKSPAKGSVCLLLRSRNAQKVLVKEGRDDKRMIHKPGFLDDRFNLGLAGKMRNVELAAAD